MENRRFRAWRQTQQRMLSWNAIQDQPLERLGGLILMVCCGLKDVNGTDIYEGDVVRVAVHPDAAIANPCVFVTEVRYDDQQLHLKLGDDTQLPDLHPATELEVIGNIYEQPELASAK